MSQEEKQLLLKDLCARLPYGVKVLSPWENDGPCVLSEIDVKSTRQIRVFEDWFNVEEVKPYLRPMSSMTEEEIDLMWQIYENSAAAEGSSGITDLLNERHLDHHHLIEKGLALEASKDMYDR